jgi:hypothetical protein
VQAVVLIPAFDRPEMVWLCLDYLAECPEVRDVEIRVCIDGRRGSAPIEEYCAVLSRFPALAVGLWRTPVHTYRGNSYNVLTAYADAYYDGFDWVYLIEDDVLVRPEFFTWHQHAHACGMPAASIGVSDPGHGAFASLGVCLPRATVGLVLPHVTSDYFASMRDYCRWHFPPSPFDCEQDGLWARLLAGRRVAWAHPPVASHVGWYGYHRVAQRRPEGTLQQRYDDVRAVLADSRALRRESHDRTDVSVAVLPNEGGVILSTVPGRAP